MTMDLRVLIANPSPLLRSVLRRACEGDAIHVLGEASTSAEALAQSRQNRPHVVLSSTEFTDGSLTNILQGLLTTGARTLVVGDAPSASLLNTLLIAGVSGYLYIDQVGASELVAGVRTVAVGDAALHPAAAALVLQQWRASRPTSPSETAAPRTDLTARELEVLTAMAEGLATKAIAIRLGVAMKTVENHKARVFAKLGARNHAHAVTLAVAQGLLSPSYQPVGESRP
ncbi:MAG TPA: response regulator transcription factor [Acidimicrobiales bacterium]|nr:response regulator transcription factor [Acidimicrobiales bacterium]